MTIKQNEARGSGTRAVTRRWRPRPVKSARHLRRRAIAIARNDPRAAAELHECFACGAWDFGGWNCLRCGSNDIMMRG